MCKYWCVVHIHQMSVLLTYCWWSSQTFKLFTLCPNLRTWDLVLYRKSKFSSVTEINSVKIFEKFRTEFTGIPSFPFRIFCGILRNSVFRYFRIPFLRGKNQIYFRMELNLDFRYNTSIYQGEFVFNKYLLPFVIRESLICLSSEQTFIFNFIYQ